MAEILTESQLRQARRLIKGLCANYDNGRCLILDSICPQYVSYTLLCNYFREAVLPEDKELTTAVYGEPVVRSCLICGEPLQAKSNRAKYCSKCAIFMRRKRQAGYEQTRRENQAQKMSF